MSLSIIDDQASGSEQLVELLDKFLASFLTASCRHPSNTRTPGKRSRIKFERSQPSASDAIRGKPRAHGVSGHGREGSASRERGCGNNLTPAYLAPPTTPVIDSLSLCVPSRTSSCSTDRTPPRSTDRTPQSRRTGRTSSCSTSRTPPRSTSCRTGALAAPPAAAPAAPATLQAAPTGVRTGGDSFSA
jgi:hypothetical protein